MPRAKSPASPASPIATAAPAENGAAAADKGSSIESIAQDIATAIVEKRLPPGTWLREEALGRVYSVSRTKIRAALLMLSKDKLIEMIPDKGAFVCQPTVQEAREVFAVRRILESEVVRLFIANARPRDYQVLEQHIRFERTALRQTTTTGTVRAAHSSPCCTTLRTTRTARRTSTRSSCASAARATRKARWPA
jgi:DNA-binding GntR family transcriptional regulator